MYVNVCNFRHNVEKTQLQNEIESMKEMLHRYEKSVERKDQVISNLTNGLQKHKEKNDLMRTFCDWKISHNDSKKEVCFMFFVENVLFNSVLKCKILC